MPNPGDIVKLSDPYYEVEVTEVSKTWVHVKPHNREAFHDRENDKQPPARIKAKHWSLKLAA